MNRVTACFFVVLPGRAARCRSLRSVTFRGPDADTADLVLASVIGALTAWGVERPVLVGHSDGATIALLKGRANYVCWHHLQRNLSEGRFARRESFAYAVLTPDGTRERAAPRTLWVGLRFD